MNNMIKKRFLNGEFSIGSFIELATPISVEAAGIAGLDYVLIDMEHSPVELEQVGQCIRAAELKNTVPFVRIKEISRGNILKCLDLGAKGIVIPGVRTVDEVYEIVRHAKYRPIGERGFCPTRCCEFGYNNAMPDGINAYTKECNDNIWVMPQCETIGCLENIDEIVNIEGVDGIFIGPFDLSLSLGKPGNFEDDEVKAAFVKIKDVCKKAKKPVFIFTPGMEAAKLRISEGYDGICYSSDLNIMLDSYLDVMRELRN